MAPSPHPISLLTVAPTAGAAHIRCFEVTDRCRRRARGTSLSSRRAACTAAPTQHVTLGDKPGCAPSSCVRVVSARSIGSARIARPSMRRTLGGVRFNTAAGRTRYAGKRSDPHSQPGHVLEPHRVETIADILWLRTETEEWMVVSLLNWKWYVEYVGLRSDWGAREVSVQQMNSSLPSRFVPTFRLPLTSMFATSRKP